MSDLISRQAAIDEAEEWIEIYGSERGGQRERNVIKQVIRGIKKLPSVQPEIIRCKDCKHFFRGIPCVGGFYDGCDELTDNGNEMQVDEDFYCGYAERREE